MARPLLTIREATAAAGVDRRTITRRLSEGRFPNATRDESRPGAPWLIPAADLIAAGLTLRAAPHGDPEAAPHPTAEADELRRQLVAVTAERDRWRAVADERQAAVELAQLALRALPPAGGTASPRRWWRRQAPAPAAAEGRSQ